LRMATIARVVGEIDDADSSEFLQF
jgi:hypothetical protein